MSVFYFTKSKKNAIINIRTALRHMSCISVQNTEERNNAMKKILSLLLAAVTAVSLTSCANTVPEPEYGQAQTGNAVTAEASTQTDSADVVSLEAPTLSSDSRETPADTALESGSDEITVSSDAPEQTSAAPEQITSSPEQTTSITSSATADPQEFTAGIPEQNAAPDENGSYTRRDDVALYIHTYGHLPQNFITKKEARELGWSGGSVEDYAPGKCIGGDHFGNYEGLLPDKPGRSYTECDIDTLGKSGRGAKRIIFSNDGLIYYTEDHYSSFTLLYGEE